MYVQGVRPFSSDKFGITQHQEYKYLSNYDRKNSFDVEQENKTGTVSRSHYPVKLYLMDSGGKMTAVVVN